jgi:D-xylulose reductase
VTIPIAVVSQKELVLKGCFRYGPGDYELAVHLLSTGKLQVKSLISQKVKFKEAENAFKQTKEGKGIKILIEGPSV